MKIIHKNSASLFSKKYWLNVGGLMADINNVCKTIR